MSLEHYQQETFEFPGPDGKAQLRHDVYHRSSPGAVPVIILHELFGLSPALIALGDYLAERFSVYLPSLFGRPGRGGPGNAARVLCVRREFTFFVTGKTSPVTTWVRGLAAVAAQRAGGRPVGLIGMCLTGSVVFAAVADPNIRAGVAAQPSLPFPVLGPLTPSHVRRDLGASPSDLEEAAAEATDVMMLRYRGDWMCPALRRDTAVATFGGVDRVQTDEEDGSVSSASGAKITIVEIDGRGHSVLGVDLNERARDIVKEFLVEHLDQG